MASAVRSDRGVVVVAGVGGGSALKAARPAGCPGAAGKTAAGGGTRGRTYASSRSSRRRRHGRAVLCEAGEGVVMDYLQWQVRNSD